MRSHTVPWGSIWTSGDFSQPSFTGTTGVSGLERITWFFFIHSNGANIDKQSEKTAVIDLTAVDFSTASYHILFPIKCVYEIA